MTTAFSSRDTQSGGDAKISGWERTEKAPEDAPNIESRKCLFSRLFSAVINEWLTVRNQVQRTNNDDLFNFNVTDDSCDTCVYTDCVHARVWLNVVRQIQTIGGSNRTNNSLHTAWS